MILARHTADSDRGRLSDQGIQDLSAVAIPSVCRCRQGHCWIVSAVDDEIVVVAVS